MKSSVIVGVSDWVRTLHGMDKTTGFVVAANVDTVEVFVTIPEDYGYVTKKRSEVWLADDTMSPDDISSLIDVSLAIKDQALFQKLCDEMKLWRKAEEVFHKETSGN